MAYRNQVKFLQFVRDNTTDMADLADCHEYEQFLKSKDVFDLPTPTCEANLNRKWRGKFLAQQAECVEKDE